MQEKVSILYLIPSLDDGGAQRFSIHFLRNIDRKKFKITLLLLKKNGELRRFLPLDIEVIQYDLSRILFSVFVIIKEVKRLNPQIVFSTLGHLNLLIAVIKSFFPKNSVVVARETSIVSLRNKDEKYPMLFDLLFKTVYKKLDLVICQSMSMKQDLIDNYGVPEKILKVIYNPVDFSFIKESLGNNERTKNDKIFLLSVGRLAPPKGYDRILKAFSLTDFTNYHLKILGQGPLKASLQGLIESLGLTNNVELVGYSDNPFLHMYNSDCLLLGSLYEGLPNVVLEANSCGTPVIAFNSPGGVGELIHEGFNGWLVKNGDIHSFAEMIRSKKFLEVDRSSIRQNVIDKFGIRKIMVEYEDELLNILAGRKNT
jgi:glycosyltransferase involved in cell wall biosynthesis